ncbi:serine hydrolase [Sphaerisporangium dianthi]|uniref:Serine hydrolase n=1 Tax=Sphaerisporangium dianthi TaxID=1436120 RepID=A0ABV9C8G2_9ACTN
MRKPCAVLAAAVVALCAACDARQGAPERDSAAPAAPATRAAASRCDGRLGEGFDAWAKAGFSGSIAISTAGRFDCLAAYGRADQATGRTNTPSTVFSIGSVTKAFTAASVFGLVDEGKLSLDDQAGEILPQLRGPVAKATVRQLLLHTSGLNGSHGADYQPLGRDAALAAIDGLTPAFRPGTGYLYSNAGYTLLALIIDKVSGTGYRKYTAAATLRLPGGAVAGGFWSGEPSAPGPRAIGYLDDGAPGQRGDFAGPHWALDGNGGLAMTTRDLASWTYALFTGRIVSPASAKAISSPGYDQGDGTAETPGWVRYGTSKYGTPLLVTAGGGGDVGHNAVVAWLPERRQVIAMASNTPKVSAERLLEVVGPAVISGDPLPAPPAQAGDDDAARAAAIVGTYRLDTGGSFEVTATGGRTAISASGADAVAALFPPRRVPAAELRANEGRVLALLGGQTQEGRKERAGFERSFGPISGFTLRGTAVIGGDVRTYVAITARDKVIIGWYFLNEEGGIGAAQVPAEPPRLPLVASGDGGFRPDDPTGSAPDVTVEVAGGRLTVSGPAGTTIARSARSAGTPPSEDSSARSTSAPNPPAAADSSSRPTSDAPPAGDTNGPTLDTDAPPAGDADGPTLDTKTPPAGDSSAPPAG